MLGRCRTKITRRVASIEGALANPIEEGKAVEAFFPTRQSGSEPSEERVIIGDGWEVRKARLGAMKIANEQQQGVIRRTKERGLRGDVLGP